MCDNVLLLTVLVCNVILSICLPLQNLTNPVTTAPKTLHGNDEITLSHHGNDNNKTLLYTNKNKRSFSKALRSHLKKHNNNKTKKISSQEPSVRKFNRNIEITESSQSESTTQLNDYNDYSYDYQALLKEYYMESQHEGGSVDAYQPVNANLKETSILYLMASLFSMNTSQAICTTTNDISLRGIICLIEDIKSNKHPLEIVNRLWKITKIWLLVYLVVAVPLWCTKGWCCCCLTCKFFKPQQTIEEARRFLLLNPPGVYQKTNRREIHYNPSDREKECYEEFEHLIKTL